MNRIIYSIKIYLFRNQTKVNAIELKNIRHFLYFVNKVYIKLWFQTPFTSSAPNNDLTFIRKTIALTSKIPTIVTAEKNKNHLWYLNSVNAALGFFDDNVTIEMKREMVRHLDRPCLSNPHANSLRLVVDDIRAFEQITLPNLISIKTRSFFQQAGICADWKIVYHIKQREMPSVI